MGNSCGKKLAFTLFWLIVLNIWKIFETNYLSTFTNSLKIFLMKKIFHLFIILFCLQGYSQLDPLQVKDSIAQNKWVDSVFNTMTVDQKVGQLFMVAAFSNKDKKHTDYISSLVKNYHLGGLCFFQGTANAHVTLINKYQSEAKIPLLISMDGEWGLDMRLDNTIGFPYNMALGAIRNDKLLFDMGKSVAQQYKRLGLHIDFAPVVDINTNPKNPVIGNRSYGENKYNVTQKAMHFMQGLQSEHIIGSAKHFPGHGDTAQDSHKTLPTVDLSESRIESIELYPYKEMIKNGLTGVLVAHLSVPSLEPDVSLPTSLSENVVTEMLKEKMQFKGLIFTDALNMKGAANFAKPGQIDLKAFEAGNDVLLYPEDVLAGIKEIKKALKSKKISMERLDYSVRKILKAKYWVGLNHYQPASLENLEEDINSTKNQLINRKLVENSITVIQNKNNVLPIRDLDINKVAYVQLGSNDNNTFVNRLNDYTAVDVIKAEKLDQVINELKDYRTVIISFHASLGAYASYQIADQDLVKLQEIAREKRVILDVFASPYSLLKIKSFQNIDAVVVSYQNTELAQDISAQMIFGALDARGKLPVNINDNYSEGYGLYVSNIQRLGYAIPEEVQLDSKKLDEIDKLAQVVIDSSMAPGMQVLVARHGKIVYRKSFGYYTYDKLQKVENNSMYDLASVTKILGGLPMIMKAEEDGKFNLETTLGEMMPVLKNSNKDTLTVKETLSHYAKLKPYISYYNALVEGEHNEPKKKYFQHARSSKYSIEVADHLYLRTDYIDTIYKLIAEAPQRTELEYVYSGLPFYLFVDYLQKQYKMPLDQLNNKFFYAPLGAKTLTYNPLKKFPKSQIVPTEKDDFFRHQLLQGYVHDEGAAMMGGVSGNAGLFGTSNDVAKMMQMYLQNGYYGGKSFLKPETINTFNFRYFEDKGNRRGLTFDKPQLDPKEQATCGCTSFKSFGHSGYTGTYTFVDPDSEIVYVFMSNRVYPTRENNLLGKHNIRTRVQGLIQAAIID
jgi:beta-N-acetylhexosaminidase